MKYVWLFSLYQWIVRSEPNMLLLGAKRPYSSLEKSAILPHQLTCSEQNSSVGTPHQPDSNDPVVFVALVARHGARFPTRAKFNLLKKLALRLMTHPSSNVSSGVNYLVSNMKVGSLSGLS
jgi:hypothetical protein